MKKILTTTVMTAILATSGFALDGGDAESKDPVGKVLYGTFDFTNGTDSYPSTIMPSGKVNIGDSTNIPVIASKWIFEEGSRTEVRGNGFQLTGTININPRDGRTIPYYIIIDDSGKLYHKYLTDNGYVYYKSADGTGCFYDMDKTIAKPQPDEADLTLHINPASSGLPYRCGNTMAQIDMAYAADGEKVQGKICGGTATYAPSGATILSAESAANLTNTSLKDTKFFDRFTLSAADSAGSQEKYLRNLPTLKYTIGETTNTLDFTDSNTYSEKISDTSTLEGYLNSFGFYPNITTVLNGTGYDLLATKGSEAAIQIPTDTVFSTAASNKTYEVKTNLHNVCAEEFTSALSFTKNGGTGMDTLVFSGDNSNLKPDNGVTYTDVNVTFCDEDAWIEPKAEGVIFKGSQTNRSITPTLTIDKSLSIHSNVTMQNGAILAIGEGQTVKFFGNLTFS